MDLKTRGVIFSVALFLGGCANITLPERIDVGYGGDRPAKVDSRQVPETSSHSDCRTELNRAYGYIRTLERKVQKLEEDKAKLKQQNSMLNKRLKRYEHD